MLKKSAISPAQPWRAETRLFPCFGSHLESIFNVANRDRTALAVRGGWVRKLRLRCFLRARPCWTSFLSVLRDKFSIRVETPTIAFPESCLVNLVWGGMSV